MKIDMDVKTLSKEECTATAQKELSSLERDFQRMLYDREAVSRKNKVALANQRKFITLLEQEKQVLLNQIEHQSKPKMHARETGKTVEAIRNLLIQYENILNQKKEKTTQLEDVSMNIKGVLKKIDGFNFSLASQKNDPVNDEKTGEQLKREFKEELGKFDQIEVEVEQLRQEANHLLSERIKFNKTAEAIAKDLSDGKKMIFDLMEQCKLAYENRRKQRLNNSSLKKDTEKRFHVNAGEAWSAKQEIEYRLNLNKFLEVKDRERDHSLKEAEKECEGDRRHKALIEKLEFYNVLIEQILRVFQPSDLVGSVSEFMKLEEENFNIFTFLNEQVSRVNSLELVVDSIENSVRKQRMVNYEAKNEQHRGISKLGTDCLEKQKELKKFTCDLEKSNNDLANLFQGIKEIFDNIHCDWSEFLQLLGNNETVGRHNLEDFLNAIELRLQRITTHFRYKLPQSKKGGGVSKDFGSLKKFSIGSNVSLKWGSYVDASISTTLPATPCPLCLEVLDSSDKEATVMPLDPSEVKSIVEEERRRGRWKTVMHLLAECPLPQAQRIMQRKQSAS